MGRLRGTPAPQHVEQAAQPRPLIPRMPAWRWFLPRWAQSLVATVVITLGVLSVAVGQSMALLGAPRATFLGAAGAREVQTFVGSFTKQGTVGNQDITVGADAVAAMNARPYAIVFSTAYRGGAVEQVSGTWYSHTNVALGYAASTGGTGGITEFSCATASDDALATSDSARRIAAKALTLVAASDSATIWEFGLVGPQGTDQLRINWSTNTTDQPRINYTIVTGLTGAKVVSWTSPSAAGPKSVADVGFSPDLVLHAGAFRTAVPSAGAGVIFGCGAMNAAGEQWSNGISSADARADSATSRWQRTDSCLALVQYDDSALERATYTSMDPAGFTLDFPTADTDAAYYASLCMNGVTSKIGSFTKANGAAPYTQTVASGHGFTPVGALFTAANRNGANVSPSADATWSLGATDGTNHRVAALQDLDAQATTSAKSVWKDTQALVVPNGSTTVEDGASFAPTLRSTDFDAVWNPSESSPHQVLYLLLG